MSGREALRLAEEKQQDLVEIAPAAKPPVCKLMDFGKYKYEQSKREKRGQKKAEGYQRQRG
jgi:translation initiation factor IF-3